MYRIVRVVVLVVATIVPISLITNGTVQNVLAAGSSLSQSYKSTTDITNGSLVALDTKQAGYVIPANNQNSQQLLGVVVSSDGSALSINTYLSNVHVALSGKVNALVSTLNGSISVGTPISASPINGVGMKALPGAQLAGVSQANFGTKSSGALLETVKDKNGVSHVIAVGYVPIVINVGFSSSQNSGIYSNILQGFVSNIVGHQVSALAAAASTIIAVLATLAVIVLLYGAIRGSIVSVGRNPLAKPAIFESLAQVVAIATLVVAMAIVIIYLLLH